MHLNRIFVGSNCGDITCLVLVLYIHSSSTSPRVSDTLQNATIDLTNNRFSQNGSLNTTSRLISTHYGFSKKIAKPGSNKQDKSAPLSENTIFLDMDLPKSKYELSKEATDFLLWLDIDPVPSNSLHRLNSFKKNSESVLREQDKILDLLHKTFTLNLISFKSKRQAQKLGEIQDKKTKSRRSLNNSSSIIKENTPKALLWNGSAGSLKRFRRQAEAKEVEEAEEAEEAEFPRWPGAPQGVLRKGLSKTATQRKIYNMMTRALYLTEERLRPLGSIVKKYYHFTPYRMAFIFLKLDQLILEMHSILAFVNRKYGDPAMNMERRLQLYGHLVRRNIDVSYLTDYIMERVPVDQVIRIRQAVIRQEQERIMINQVMYGR